MSTPTPSVEQLQADVQAARDQLSLTIGELKAATQPAALVKQAGNAAAGVFKNADGSIRVERVAIAAAVVVGLVGLRLLTRRRR